LRSLGYARDDKIHMREYKFYLYITTNKIHTCFYTGISNNLLNRYFQHKSKLNPDSFTAKYNVTKLVYYEEYQYIHDAITREKQIKKWRQEKKINLIKTTNPQFKDLSKDF